MDTPQFSIPNVYSDHMIFQRGRPIRFVGTAHPLAPIVVSFDGVRKTVKADKNGKWAVEFPPLEAGTGHNASIENEHKTEIKISDIAIGDVWIAGGQSNMEFPVVGSEFYGLPGGWDLAGEFKDPDLRILHVQRSLEPDGPCFNLPARAEWKPATSRDAIGICSAVGFLFAQRLRKRLGIPVGVVSVNWGGCRIEPWIDTDTLRRHNMKKELAAIEQARKAAIAGPDKKTLDAQREKDKRFAILDKWLKEKFFKSNPKATKAALASWAKPGIDLSAWTRGKIPLMAGAKLPGVIWYRREVELPEGWDAKKLRVRADWMNDTDEAFWDGIKIGSTWIDKPVFWNAMRDYPVPPDAGKPGKHILAIRLANHFGAGGIGNIWLAEDGSDKQLQLTSGEWAERIELRPSKQCGERPVSPIIGEADPRNDFTLPSTLFNAMFAPLTPFRYKGAIWYQGCSNVCEGLGPNRQPYEKLQKLLVESWRRTTDSPDLAFLQVQLAGYQRNTPENRLPDDFWTDFPPVENGWSDMRAAQAKIRSTRLADLVTATDIGDHSDIHPSQKREVARRLEALAAKLVYGVKGTTTGPILSSVKKEGKALRCAFTEIGKGLVVKPRSEMLVSVLGGAGKRDRINASEHAFAIASSSGKWHWADAIRDGDTVVVSSPEVPNPVRVRYAWAMFPPSMRLFNKDGFPMFPFEGKAK